ncbi:MAG: hypothetical protein NAG76_17595 [Candidatus Pristimantibacillus lignocellulolyticus]|uniref:Uncharacterized protein n=1 Tax=Candidatus Pristimantibacillus lignocellulolyticus TaxID=2994561 RepID=A0A9J6ZC11_9BACL|nr:MAG: hypothetical protein NAG76_17595 [Candidatus Pristimantibacillus lignocellulolyticus]
MLYGKDNGGNLTSHTTLTKNDHGIYYGGSYPGSTALYITNKNLLEQATTFILKIDSTSMEYSFNEKYYILEHENIMKHSHSLEFFDVDGKLLYKDEVLLNFSDA